MKPPTFVGAARAAQRSLVGSVAISTEKLYLQSVFSAAGIMENLLLLVDFMRLRSCLKSQECGFGKIYFQHFLPALFNDFVFKFQDRKECAKKDLFFSLLLVNSSCSVHGTLRKMI